MLLLKSLHGLRPQTLGGGSLVVLCLLQAADLQRCGVAANTLSKLCYESVSHRGCVSAPKCLPLFFCHTLHAFSLVSCIALVRDWLSGWLPVFPGQSILALVLCGCLQTSQVMVSPSLLLVLPDICFRGLFRFYVCALGAAPLPSA